MRPAARGSLACLVVLLCAGPAVGWEADDYPVFGQQTLRRTLELPVTGPIDVRVDNLYGPITVVGTDVDAVEMVAHETVRAADAAEAARARREVRLDVSVEGGVADLFVDGPFRDRQNRKEWAHDGQRAHYAVRYEFELRVPRRAALDLRTVLDGDIRVTGVLGDLRIHDVTGDLHLEGVAGGGEVGTVSGSVFVDYATNPRRESRFETVSGDIEVHFRPDLAADLRLTSTWGSFFTDFEVEELAAQPAMRHEGDRWIIETNSGPSVRIAGGGPLLSFETLSGNVYIRKTDNQR